MSVCQFVCLFFVYLVLCLFCLRVCCVRAGVCLFVCFCLFYVIVLHVMLRSSFVCYFSMYVLIYAFLIAILFVWCVVVVTVYLFELFVYVLRVCFLVFYVFCVRFRRWRLKDRYIMFVLHYYLTCFYPLCIFI